MMKNLPVLCGLASLPILTNSRRIAETSAAQDCYASYDRGTRN